MNRQGMISIPKFNVEIKIPDVMRNENGVIIVFIRTIFPYSSINILYLNFKHILEFAVVTIIIHCMIKPKIIKNIPISFKRRFILIPSYFSNDPEYSENETS